MSKSLTNREKAAGGILVASAILVQTVVMGRAIMVLNAGLIVAYFFWAAGSWQHAHTTRVLRWYSVGLGCFLLHFLEERIAGFYRELPALAGYQWTVSQFVAFNVTWFVIFAIGWLACRSREPIGYLVVLFFALGGGLLNGVGHVALALMFGRYFPGLLTAALMLAVGVALLKVLYPPPLHPPPNY